MISQAAWDLIFPVLFSGSNSDFTKNGKERERAIFYEQKKTLAANYANLSLHIQSYYFNTQTLQNGAHLVCKSQEKERWSN